MELREVFVSNIILGNVHNKSNLDNLPDFTTPLSYHNPYIEVGVGLENIFKVLRINAIWRLTHKEKYVCYTIWNTWKCLFRYIKITLKVNL